MTYPALTNRCDRSRVAAALRSERRTLALCRREEAALGAGDPARTRRLTASLRAAMRERLTGMRTLLAVLYT